MESLWTQTLGPCGLYVVLTSKGENMEIWARYDESFIYNEQVHPNIDEYVIILSRVLRGEQHLADH